MNTQIILAGLKARPVRTGVGVLAVALEVVLIIILAGLTMGGLSDTGNRVAGVGGEIIFKPDDSSFFLGMSGSVLPLTLGQEVAQREDVLAVAPVVAQMEQTGGLTMVWGIDPQSFEAMSGGFTWVEGRMFSSPDEVVIDERIAGARMWKLGSRIMTLNRSFTVTGIVKSGKGARIFIPIRTAQEMVNRTDPASASVFYIKLKDKSQTERVIKELETEYPGRDIIDAEEWLSFMYASNSDLLGIVFNVILFIGVSVGVLVIFLSMYTTVTERTREIGILRAMGASKAFIVVLVIQESFFLCLIGTGLGIGTSLLMYSLFRKFLPTLSILITAGWVARASIFALISGVIGSLYPAIKAASQDPIEALAYE